MTGRFNAPGAGLEHPSPTRVGEATPHTPSPASAVEGRGEDSGGANTPALAAPTASQPAPRPLTWPRWPCLLPALYALAHPGTQAATPDTWCPPAQQQVLAREDFDAGLARWRVEAEDPRSRVQTVRHQGRPALELHTPAGLSLWWQQPLTGDYALRFIATPLPAPAEAGPALAGRVSDLNMFWNATEAHGSPPHPRNGAFAAYDDLRAYYVGFGANGNRSTRLRRYKEGERELLDGWADAPEANAADRQGAMTGATRLHAGVPVAVQIVSRQATAQDPATLRWWADGRLLFEFSDPAPRTAGRFAFRTTASAWRLEHIELLGCTPPR